MSWFWWLSSATSNGGRPETGVVPVDDTDSRPRDNFSISAPNWCKAVIVDGVGSCILSMETHFVKSSLKKIIKNCNHLESGNHSSCVSNVDSSVSVDVAEWAWFGVDGKLVLSNRRHVHRRSAYIYRKSIYFLNLNSEFTQHYLKQVLDPTIHLTILRHHPVDCHNHPNFGVAVLTVAQSDNRLLA